jgi:hypothetical protein
MAKQEKVTRDEHYDLVSVLYHALQGDETLNQYIEDAEAADDDELVEHFRHVNLSGNRPANERASKRQAACRRSWRG